MAMNVCGSAVLARRGAWQVSSMLMCDCHNHLRRDRKYDKSARMLQGNLRCTRKLRFLREFPTIFFCLDILASMYVAFVHIPHSNLVDLSHL